MSLTPRQGVLSRLYKIKEISAPTTYTWGTDPTTPVKNLVPLFGTDEFRTTQPRNAATIYDGVRSSKGSWKGFIDASGTIPVSMDYKYCGVDLDCHLGHAVYSRSTISGWSRHRWIGQGEPIPYQLQEEHTQTTAIIHRNKGIISQTMEFPTAVQGQQMYNITQLGNGDEAYTDVGGSTVSYQPFVAYNYFDGGIYLNGTQQVAITNFSLTIDNTVSRVDAAFHSGLSAAYNLGNPVIRGTFELLFTKEDGDTFYNLAINDTISTIVCYYLNKPVTGGPTMWLRFKIPAVLFSRRSTGAGGQDALRQSQEFFAQVPTADNPALAWASIVGPYVVPASSHIYVKIDGGTTLDIPITTGTRSAAQIATELNADVGFTAAAVASDFNGSLQVESKSTVAGTSKVQFQGGTGNLNSVLGTDTTIWTGDAASMLITDLVNTVTSDY